MNFKAKVILSCLACSLLLAACGPSSCGGDPATPKAPGAVSPTDEADFKRSSVAINPAKQATDQGVSSLTQYQLPAGVDIQQVKVVKASLDGRDISPSDISLGKDNDENVVFFINKSVFNDVFAGQAVQEAKSIHTSDTFNKKKQALRTQLLEEYKDSAKETVENKDPIPSFLTATVRGESLSRQQVATLKKDGGKLAKEGVFIDRNFYAVLEVNAQQFTVSQAQARQLMAKFDIPGQQIEKVVQALKAPASDQTLLRLPAVAEKIATGDASFFKEVQDIQEAKRTIEIEEIEEVLEVELGGELVKQGVAAAEFELNLDIKDLLGIEQKDPTLAADATVDAKDDVQENIAEILAKANQTVQEIQQTFTQAGVKWLSDNDLFDRSQTQEDKFKDFKLEIRLEDIKAFIDLLKGRQETPPPPSPSATLPEAPTPAPTATGTPTPKPTLQPTPTPIPIATATPVKTPAPAPSPTQGPPPCGQWFVKADGSVDVPFPNGAPRTLFKGQYELQPNGAIKILKPAQPDTGAIINPPPCGLPPPPPPPPPPGQGPPPPPPPCGQFFIKPDGSVDLSRPDGTPRTLFQGQYEKQPNGAIKILKPGEPDTGAIVSPPPC